MRPLFAVIALGLLAVILEGALAHLLPGRFVPALSLLVAAAAALSLPPLAGLVAAVVLGLGTDMVSGALLGQHAFLRVIEWAATRGLARQLDLVRAGPFAIFAAALVVLDAAGFAALSRGLLGPVPFHLSDGVAVATRAAVTVVFAPAIGSAVRRMVERFGEREARREMRLDTRRPVL